MIIWVAVADLLLPHAALLVLVMASEHVERSGAKTSSNQFDMGGAVKA